MDDTLDTDKGLGKELTVEDRALEILRLSVSMARRRAVHLLLERVEHANPVAGSQEAVDQVGADKTGPAGDENR